MMSPGGGVEVESEPGATSTFRHCLKIFWDHILLYPPCEITHDVRPNHTTV